MIRPLSLDFDRLASAYADGRLAPSRLVEVLLARLQKAGSDAVWIQRVPADRLRARGRQLDRLLAGSREQALALPLFGVPFAVKDNIDVAGLPVTAGCPGFAYEPEHSAPVVERLLAAGAILVGKTNLDQFATGLVGTRSPYGTARNAFDRHHVPGGSSSGSAVAVASGLVSFALGTDTAGSGRVPAAFGNIVGLKPTPGLVSTRGTVPACRSLDCVSIFALTCADAARTLAVIEGYDADDPYSRPRPLDAPEVPDGDLRFGVLAAEDREFGGDEEAARLYDESVQRLAALGGRPVTIDFAPFRETADLLYQGPWVAERLAELESFLDAEPDAVHPVTRQIIGSARRFSAADAFRALHRLEALRRTAGAVWEQIDVMLVPTTPTIPTLAEVQDDPIGPNTRLGHYTNFVNLLGLAALAVPAGFRADGLPLGVTLVGPAFSDAALARLGGRMQEDVGLSLGATGHPLADPAPDSPGEDAGAPIDVVVVGAHLSGEAANRQLRELGARFVAATRTAPEYRLHAIDDQRPGLVRAEDGDGVAIEAEIWSLTPAALGTLVAGIRPPLGIGTISLEDGTQRKGFVCEAYAVRDAEDISGHGGWRGYRASLAVPAG